MDGVILCGGEGLRMRPLTNHIQKCMLKVRHGDEPSKPAVEYVFRNFECAHIDKVFLVVGYKKEQVIRHFDSIDKKSEVVYVEQAPPFDSTTRALSTVEKYVKNEFVCSDGDILYPSGLIESLYPSDLGDTYAKIWVSDGLDVAEAHPRVLVGDERVIDIKRYEDSGFNELPLSSMSVYLMSKGIFPYLKKEEQISKVLRNIVKDDKKIAYMIYKGGWRHLAYESDISVEEKLENNLIPYVV